MLEILTTIKDFSPIGVIALSLIIIWQLTRNGGKVNELKDNNLDLKNKGIISKQVEKQLQ